MRSRKPSGRGSSLSDHAVVRGVRPGYRNLRKGSRREATLRSLARLAKGAAVVGVVAGVGFGAHEAWAWARQTPRFAIEEIAVEGAGRASADVLRRLSGVEVGDNVFEVDTAAATEGVVRHPWVRAADIERRYPRGLRIAVEEHEPVVLVALEHLYYANAAGEIVKRYAPGEREELPVVTGLSREAVEADAPEARAMLGAALELLAAWERTHPEGGADLAEIHVDEARGLSVVPRADGARVALGWGPWAEKIARLDRIERTLRSRGVRASHIGLNGARRPERVVVRLARSGGGGA